MSAFLAPESAPLLIATLVLLAIAVVEGLGLFLGLSASHWLDGLVGDHSLHVPDSGLLEAWLGWLHVGRVPILVLVVVFLGAFSVIGFAANAIVHGLLGVYIPALLAAPAAVVAAMPVVRFTGGALARLMPKDESSAVTLDSLIGRLATVVSGTARAGFPAQAKVTSEHGQVIYLMVEPDQSDVTFAATEQVLLVKRVSGTRFQGIRNPRPDLL
jgi:hypothetical protein